MDINMETKTVGPKDLKEYTPLSQKCSQANLVLPSGLIHNSLCVVGESLGADENIQGDYFVGKAGKLLDKLLKESGIIRSASHITNVVKVQPPGNKVQRLNELGLSVQDFVPYLKEELDTIKPRAILALGRYALEALTEEEGITKWRGSVLDCKLTKDPVKVVPTLHPSYLQRGMMHLYPYVRHDIQNFAKVGFGIYKPEDPYEQIIDPTLSQCLDFLHEVYISATETCFDIETVAHQRITCIGWTNGPHKAICIPFRHNGLKLRWAEHEQIMLLEAMKQVYQKPGLLKIGQNMHYDMHFLLPLLGFPREPLFDTRYAHTLLHADSKHDLGFLTSVYTNMNYHKDEAKDWESKKVPKDETLWGYNIKDVITTHRVAQAIRKDLKESNQYKFFTGFMMPFRRVIFDMESHGINVDTALMKELREYIEEDELPIALDIIKTMTGREMNPNSSKQVGEYLAEELHLPVPRTPKGNYTVKEDVLESLIARHPKHRQLLKQILCARVLKAKDLGTYLTAVVSKDNHMKCSYGMTITGRLTSSANQVDEGTNLQNVPKHLREIFIPEPGQVFVEADLSQAEARVMAWLMKSDKLKDVFRRGEKIHKIVGGWIYDKDPEELTPNEYLTAKKTVHGSNYQMGERKFATIIERPVAEARKIMAKYAQVVPELPQYHRDIQKEIETKRRLVTIYGRTRVFTGRLDDSTFKSGYAQIPQSTVVDTINLGILGLWCITPRDVHFATQTHDSILLSVDPDKVDFWTPYIKAHLETLRELEINGDRLVIPLDIDPPKDNWYGK